MDQCLPIELNSVESGLMDVLVSNQTGNIDKLIEPGQSHIYYHTFRYLSSSHQTHWIPEYRLSQGKENHRSDFGGLWKHEKTQHALYHSLGLGSATLLRLAFLGERDATRISPWEKIQKIIAVLSPVNREVSSYQGKNKMYMYSYSLPQM